MSYEGFARKGMAESEAEAMFRKATTLALRARNQRVSTSTSFGPALVAASIGCYGAHLANGSEYFGRYDANVRQITAWHKRKFEVLRAASAAEARPDLVVFETIPCVDEAKAIAALLGGAEVGGCSDGVGVTDSGADEAVARGSAASSCAGWVSFACKDGATLNSGEPLEDALRALNDPAEGGYRSAVRRISEVLLSAPVPSSHRRPGTQPPHGDRHQLHAAGARRRIDQ